MRCFVALTPQHGLRMCDDDAITHIHTRIMRVGFVMLGFMLYIYIYVYMLKFVICAQDYMLLGGLYVVVVVVSVLHNSDLLRGGLPESVCVRVAHTICRASLSRRSSRMNISCSCCTSSSSTLSHAHHHHRIHIYGLGLVLLNYIVIGPRVLGSRRFGLCACVLVVVVIHTLCSMCAQASDRLFAHDV